MTLSDVFYEAALLINCGFSEGANFAIIQVGGWKSNNEYCELMRPEGEKLMYEHVNDAAKEVGWTSQDFRTFLLLMASEAVKP